MGEGEFLNERMRVLEIRVRGKGKNHVCLTKEYEILRFAQNDGNANIMFASILFPQTEISPYEDIQETLNVFKKSAFISP